MIGVEPGLYLRVGWSSVVLGGGRTAFPSEVDPERASLSGVVGGGGVTCPSRGGGRGGDMSFVIHQSIIIYTT